MSNEKKRDRSEFSSSLQQGSPAGAKKLRFDEPTQQPQNAGAAQSSTHLPFAQEVRIKAGALQGKNMASSQQSKELKSVRSIRGLKGFEQHSEKLLGDQQIDTSGRIVSIEGELGQSGRRYIEQTEGVVYEPFNLAEEREEGQFDETGAFVQKKYIKKQATEEEKQMKKSEKEKKVLEMAGIVEDEAAEKYNQKKKELNQRWRKEDQDQRRQNKEAEESDDEEADGEEEKDAWASTLEEQELKSITRPLTAEHIAQSLVKPKRPQPSKASVTLPEDPVELEFIIVNLLDDDDETVQDALERYSKALKKQQNRFETLSEASYRLSMSDPVIYTQSKAELLKKLEKRRVAAQWEYKWENKPEAPVYGPYTTEMMQAWIKQGYFRGHKIFIRQAKPTSASASTAAAAAASSSTAEEDDDDMFASSESTPAAATSTAAQEKFVPLTSLNLYKYK